MSLVQIILRIEVFVELFQSQNIKFILVKIHSFVYKSVSVTCSMQKSESYKRLLAEHT